MKAQHRICSALRSGSKNFPASESTIIIGKVLTKFIKLFSVANFYKDVQRIQEQQKNTVRSTNIFSSHVYPLRN